ncbi:MAG TPA: tRNA pseudouridine(13) synthase TruD, partial [Vibrio sp.]|nr:tRNA pseudouridine(13) synthase TruD [Vibrio sp.]
FGAQRFGNEGNNLSEARRWGRENVRTRNQNKRSLYLSAARSWIYNLILSDRIEQDAFASVLVGDIVVKDGAQLAVTADNIEAVNQDIANGSAFITVALAGDNALPTTDASQALEQKHLDAEPDLMALICGNRMRHDRR